MQSLTRRNNYYFQINPIDILAAQGGEVRNSGNADIALANKKWKWPSLNPSSVGMASLISDRYMYMYMILLKKINGKNYNYTCR